MSDDGRVHTVLVVDDEDRLRKALARSLGGRGRRTLTAASGEEALRLVESEEVDLVITDLVMPGMDGMSLVRGIRSLAPDTATIIITAYGSTESMQEAEELGVSSYLAKPFDLSLLKSTVSSFLAAPRGRRGGRDRAAAALQHTSAPTQETGDRAGHRRTGEDSPGRRKPACSICLARDGALKAAVGLSRRALACVGPGHLLRALGGATRRATSAASDLAGRDRALRSICLVGGRTLRVAVDLSRRAFPRVRPGRLMLSLGRATGRVTSATAGLASAFTRKGVDGR